MSLEALKNTMSKELYEKFKPYLDMIGDLESKEDYSDFFNSVLGTDVDFTKLTKKDLNKLLNAILKIAVESMGSGAGEEKKPWILSEVRKHKNSKTPILDFAKDLIGKD